MRKENSHFIIVLLCVTGFLFLTVFIPFIGVLGGFFSQIFIIEFFDTSSIQTNEYMLDGIQIITSFNTIKVSYDSSKNSSYIGANTGFFWNLCKFYGIIYLLLISTSGFLIIFDSLFKMNRFKISFPLSFIGLALGFAGTIGEWIILFFTINIECPSGRQLHATILTPEINPLMLMIFIIGWFLLIYGHITVPKCVTSKSEFNISDT